MIITPHLLSLKRKQSTVYKISLFIISKSRWCSEPLNFRAKPEADMKTCKKEYNHPSDFSEIEANTTFFSAGYHKIVAASAFL